jgi:hypothetical protein
MFLALAFVFLAVGSSSGSSRSTLPIKGEVREACTQVSNAILAQQSGNVAGAQEEFAWSLMHAQASPDRALYSDIYVLEKATNAIVTAGGKQADDQQWIAVGRAAVSECRRQGAWPSGSTSGRS